MTIDTLLERIADLNCALLGHRWRKDRRFYIRAVGIFYVNNKDDYYGPIGIEFSICHRCGLLDQKLEFVTGSLEHYQTTTLSLERTWEEDANDK